MAILEACEKILKFVEDIWDVEAFYTDEKTFDAVLMNFVVIGESVVRLSDNLKEQNDHVPWQKIKGFRNIVAHDYFGVDAEEVWQIVKENIPELKNQIASIQKL